MTDRFLLLISTFALSAMGCADNSQPPAVANLAATNIVLAQPHSVAIPATPAAPKTVTDVEWAQLEFDLEDRSKFDLSLIPKSIRDLDGKLVRMRGFILPDVLSENGYQEFVLLGEIGSKPIDAKKYYRYPVALPLHYLMTIEMANGQSVNFTTKPIALVGRFSIRVFEMDDEPICVFHMDAESVETVKPREGYRCAIYDGC